jgi:hypothetical protein
MDDERVIIGDHFARLPLRRGIGATSWDAVPLPEHLARWSQEMGEHRIADVHRTERLPV